MIYLSGLVSVLVFKVHCSHAKQSIGFTQHDNSITSYSVKDGFAARD